MLEATLRCKRFLQVILSKKETLSVKRIQACAKLEILLEDLTEALPDDERTAVRSWRFMNNCSRNHKKPARKLGGGLAPSKPGAQMSREVSLAYSSRGEPLLQAQGGFHATPSLS
jgi:hypothetical protein